MNKIEKITLLIILSVIIIFSSFFVVKPWYWAIVINNWKVWKEVYWEGYHLKIPFIEKITLIELKKKKIEVKQCWLDTEKRWTVIYMALEYSIPLDNLSKVYNDIGDREKVDKQMVIPAMKEVLQYNIIRNNWGAFTTDGKVKYSPLNLSIKKTLTNKLSAWWIEVNEVKTILARSGGNCCWYSN